MSDGLRNLRVAAFWLAMLAAAFESAAQGTVVNNVEVRPGARVDLVFYTAEDCSWCRRWKDSGRADAVKWAGTAKFGYHEIEKRRIKDPYAAAHFPPESAFAWEQLQADMRYSFVIPRWMVFSDGRKVVEGAGLYDWNRVNRFLGAVLEARDAGSK